MKLFLGHLLGFGMMTAFCFVVMSGLTLFIPLLGAFLTWSLHPLTFDFSMTMFIARCMLLLSVFVGISFTFSNEGKQLAREFAEGK